MTKIKSKIEDRSCQQYENTLKNIQSGLQGVQSNKNKLYKNELIIKNGVSRITIADSMNTIVKSGFEVTKRISTPHIQVLCIALLLFIGIIGCSEVPYTGPVLTVDSVDRYLDSTGENTICLQDGFDTICLKVVEKEVSKEEPPTVNIYPTSITFLFHYEDRPILRAERIMDTTEIIQELIDSGQVQLPPDAEGDADNIESSREWFIEMYYPDSFPEADRGSTPDTSGLDIRVGDGKKLSENKKDDLEILEFKQITGPNGIPGVRFSVETEKEEIAIQVNGLVPEFTAKFYIKADGVTSEENTYTFQLQPNDNP